MHGTNPGRKPGVLSYTGGMYRCATCQKVKPAEEMRIPDLCYCLECERPRVLDAVLANREKNRGKDSHRAYDKGRDRCLRRFNHCAKCLEPFPRHQLISSGVIRPRTLVGRQMYEELTMKEIVQLPWEILEEHFEAWCSEDRYIEEVINAS